MEDLGLLIIRLVVGLTFVGHGAQKLFGWFGGPGPIEFGEWLGTIGITAGGKTWAILAGLFEFIGGILFSAGELTWLGAIVIVMIDAIFTDLKPQEAHSFRGGRKWLRIRAGLIPPNCTTMGSVK